MDIGKIIVEQRSKRNISQRALAQMAGIRQATLSSIEAGGEVKLTTAQNILKALDLDIDVVPRRERNTVALAERRREIARVRAHAARRRNELQLLLPRLSAQQLRQVAEINRKTNTGYHAWRRS